MTVTLVQPYDPAWPSHFEQVKAFLESGVVDVDCTIEHVGSTAIPGMMAKPTIDLDIVIAPGTLPKVKGRLEALGYVHQGDLGLPKREAFDLVEAEAKARLPEHHLYVCEEGVYELRKHLAFRDFMRRHPEWREKLNRLKRELCVKHNNDRQAYIDGKADMVEEITKLAMECSEQMHAEATSKSARSAASETADPYVRLREMEYDNTTIANRYDSARAMPEATMSLWMAAIAARVPPREVDTVLDVGCGTGRFSAQLADTFKAQVIGIDPSDTMLTRAKENVSHPRVAFRKGDAAHLPVDDESACLVYISMVYHHIGDRARAAGEFFRVLRPGGFACIRNSTQDLLDSVPYLEYFPGVLEFNRNRLPPKSHFIGTMTSAGFSLLSHEVIQQQFAQTFAEYCEKIAQRGLSDLAVLPDAEFEAGIQRMRSEVEKRERSGPILEPIDLFVFRRRAEQATPADGEDAAAE